MKQNPHLERLTAPGSPFEVGERDGVKVFAKAPQNLCLLMDQARRFGGATYLVEGERRTTFDEFFAGADALSGSLDAKPGEHVAIAMKNCGAWMTAFAALTRIGAAPVLVNSRSAGADMRAQIEDCEARLVIADHSRAAALREAGFTGRVVTPDDFPASGAAAPASSRAQTDPAAILFTSGTTGRTKGAVLTHRNLMTGLMYSQLSGLVVLHQVAEQMGVAPEAILAHHPQPASLLVYPLFHISGLGSGYLSMLLAGGKIVVMPRWDAQEALRLVPAEKITMLTGVPTMLWDILNRAKLDGADLSSLRNVASGGQALPINLLEAVTKAIPGAMMGTGFGLTETAGPIAMGMGAEFTSRPASSGRVLALAEVRTLDDAGKTLPDGEIGEIAVRGAMVMKGYWNRPQETAAVLGDDGWFRTGDIGRVDEDGFIHIVDRKKDMVISGGENIYCAEVERVMCQLPEVAEAAAFGLPDARLGERLVAVIVAERLTADDITDYVADALARYKAPTEIVFSTAPLPRNAAGKIDKKALRAAWPQLSGAA